MAIGLLLWHRSKCLRSQPELLGRVSLAVLGKFSINLAAYSTELTAKNRSIAHLVADRDGYGGHVTLHIFAYHLSQLQRQTE